MKKNLLMWSLTFAAMFVFSQSACTGFKRLGQCVAAIHIANNLNIPGGFETTTRWVAYAEVTGKVADRYF